MMLLENNVDGYKQLVELKRNSSRKEATPKYTKDPNINDLFKGWSRNGIKRYNDLKKEVTLGRNLQVSKEIEVE